MLKKISIIKEKLKDKYKLKKEKSNSEGEISFEMEKTHDKNIELAKKLNVDYSSSSSLPKAYVNNDNAFFTYSGLVYFYPPNDGAPTRPFSYYIDRDLVLRNTHAFQEIENLDEILIEMVDIIDKSFDNKIAINPYGFMLHLDEELEKDYNGKASLVMTNNSFSKNDLKHRKHFINRFLDHFIGWNFGVSVNRNEELKKALIKLNDKVIESGLREDAGPGYDVYGTETDVYKGLQHYYLPTSKDNVYVKR